MKNTERLFIRLSPQLKEDAQSLAEENNLSISDYVRGLIEEASRKPSQNIQNLSHEERIQGSLYENTFINGLFTNPELTLKSKKTITKELRKYVGH